jgi:two-component system cell cycle response regulator
MIDIDHFRRINNTHGHAVGDRVLKEIVNRATFVLRPSDLVARMGGEEFVVVLPEADFDTALQIAERLRRRVGDMPVEGGDSASPLSVSVSIGVAVVQPDGKEEPDAALQRADVALYTAKRAGRNRVSVWP